MQVVSSSPIVALAEEVARKANEPMSIDQIRGRFQVTFPFQVRKVTRSGGMNKVAQVFHVGQVISITGHSSKYPGNYSTDYSKEDTDWTTPGSLEQWVLV